MGEKEVVTSMVIPRYEYAMLIRAEERLKIVRELRDSLDMYDLEKALSVILKEPDLCD